MILILSKELDLSYFNYEEATLLYTDIALNKYISYFFKKAVKIQTLDLKYWPTVQKHFLNVHPSWLFLGKLMIRNCQIPIPSSKCVRDISER